MYRVLQFGVLFVVSLCRAAEFDYTVDIPRGRTECYFQPVTNPEHIAMEIDFQVIDGGDMDISFYIMSPQQRRLASDVKTIANSHRIELKGQLGDYGLCFDNSFSRTSNKVVFFEIFLLDKDGNYDDLPYESMIEERKEIQNLEIATEDFRTRLARIKNYLNKAEHFQSQARVAEARDRGVMENNYERVNFWSVVHLSVMMLVLVVQVYMVRSLFEDDSRVGRMIRKAKLPTL